MRWCTALAMLALFLVPSDAALAGPGLPAGPGAPAGPTAYRWPLAGAPVVTRPFEPPPRPWLPGHRGVDLAAAPGDPVLAAGPGVVAFAGSVAGVGVVSIDHPGGLRTTYEPVTALVPAGTRVAAGQPVGVLLAGHPGCPVAACLHWGLRRGTVYLDPLLLLRAARMRLYPVDREPHPVDRQSRPVDRRRRDPASFQTPGPPAGPVGQTRASRPGSSAAKLSYSSARL